jgi:hypothetical protein
MLVNVFNKVHFPIEVGRFIFNPFEETIINVKNQSEYRDLRIQKTLRINKYNNKSYKIRHGLEYGNRFNFVYDNMSQHAGEAYRYAIEALSNPIIKYMPAGCNGFTQRPLPGLNIRWFNSSRINEQGKTPVGPHDVFFSHGIGDKNYWKGSKIEDYKYAFVPGPAWEKRMRKTGYKGEIFICGYTKLDPLLNDEIEKEKKEKPYIVWAPTHGYHTKYKGRSSYPQCKTLINQIDNIYETCLAMHPTSKLHNRMKHTPTLIELLNADVVIADAGSTLYEAWALGKPVIFPDWICKQDVINHFKKDSGNFEYQIYKKEIGYHAKDMNHLNKLIDLALNNGMKDSSKEFIEEIYPKKIRGKAGMIAAKQLIELADILKI